MIALGQTLLLVAFLAAGLAACLSIAGWWAEHRRAERWGLAAGLVSVLALSGTSGILAWALVVKDFRFDYVAQYSSRQLPWHYSLSAFWVGQAGSLLLWAWLSGALAVVYRIWPRPAASGLRPAVFGVLMAFLGLLVTILVFSADPMRPALTTVPDGMGLSPLLEHPAMLVHPPVVFLGYAGWTIPFALAVVALASGRLDPGWIREARPWMSFSWLVLGLGILWGAQWAYEELGWGGYWAWDPVENGSLLPWLTGTALIHTAMVWQHRGGLKRTTLLLAVATFGLCNLATFLTRSGIFSSLHAFSQSPIGWMFLALMAAVGTAGGLLVVRRWALLAPENRIASLFSREAVISLATWALLLLAAVVLAGTLSVPLSNVFGGRRAVVGQAFYNRVLVPVGLIVLAGTALVPLVRWGSPPTRREWRGLAAATGFALIGGAAAACLGLRHPIALAVTVLAALAVAAAAIALVLDARRAQARRPWQGLWKTLRGRRRQYAALLVHGGVVCLAVGVTGSSLAPPRGQVTMRPGETTQWAGHAVRFLRLEDRPSARKRVVEAVLEVTAPGDSPYRLRPAQHGHPLQGQWTTEVAIHADWAGDFYAVLHGGAGSDQADFTFVYNPLMRWVWAAGWLAAAGVLLGLWPARTRGPKPALRPVFQRRRVGMRRPLSRSRNIPSDA